MYARSVSREISGPISAFFAAGRWVDRLNQQVVRATMLAGGNNLDLVQVLGDVDVFVRILLSDDSLPVYGGVEVARLVIPSLLDVEHTGEGDAIPASNS